MNVIHKEKYLDKEAKAKPTCAQIDMYNTFKLYTKTHALKEMLNQMERAFGICNYYI